MTGGKSPTVGAGGAGLAAGVGAVSVPATAVVAASDVLAAGSLARTGAPVDVVSAARAGTSRWLSAPT